MKNLSAYILAGGKSSRMGTEKGLQVLNEKPIIEYIIDVCKKHTSQIHIVTKNMDYNQFQLPLIQDEIEDVGPGGGIDAVLQHSTSEKNLIVSCDMPFIDSVAIQYLLDASKSFDITIPSHEGFIEPLLGIYNKGCAQQWRTLLLQETYKLSDLISHFAVNFVESKKMLLYNPHLFANLNSPEEIKIASTWIHNLK
jgi:molybdopterin-guanine dinucleotide biosynthesis protein A